MKPKLNVFKTRMGCALALGIGSSFSPAPAAEDWAGSVPPKTSEAIRSSEIGAKAGADYKGDGLAVIPSANGARLRCVFQRLEGEATREGLWLTSTVTNALKDRFRVVASAVGRRSSKAGDEVTGQSSIARMHPEPPHLGSDKVQAIAQTGTVAINGQSVRFLRPGLVEEYTVSLDGVRQDFVVLERPAGEGELTVRLAVSGATAESAAFGARLVLENSARKIAYSRLRVTDATGKELAARMEVASGIVPDREGLRPVARVWLKVFRRVGCKPQWNPPGGTPRH